jgi:hypothetical protein
MTDLRKVSGPSSGSDRQAARIIAVVVIAIGIAIIKPWGTTTRPGTIAVHSAPPLASPTARTTERPRQYDFLTFGSNEPPPAWELWPAGNLSSFYFAMRIDMVGQASESPAAAPSPTPIALATPGEGGHAPAVPGSWPTIRIPVDSHLDLLGVNSPIGFTLEVAASTRLEDDGTQTPISTVIGRSPWPEHFTIVGFAAAKGGAMEPWPAGHYRIDFDIQPGGVSRSVEIVIETTSPTRSVAPTGSTRPKS